MPDTTINRRSHLGTEAGFKVDTLLDSGIARCNFELRDVGRHRYPGEVLVGGFSVTTHYLAALVE